MRADVSLEVEGVVETLPAEGAQMSLGLVVTLDVSVEHPLILEGLLTNLQEAEPVNATPFQRNTLRPTQMTQTCRIVL